MSKTIPGVPESLTREQYLSFFTAAGIDPSNTVSLRFLPKGIEAIVWERDSEGRRFLANDTSCICTESKPSEDGDFEESIEDPACRAQHGFAKHTIFIPVEGA